MNNVIIREIRILLCSLTLNCDRKLTKFGIDYGRRDSPTRWIPSNNSPICCSSNASMMPRTSGKNRRNAAINPLNPKLSQNCAGRTGLTLRQSRHSSTFEIKSFLGCGRRELKGVLLSGICKMLSLKSANRGR